MQITSCLRVVLLESEILKCLHILKSSQQKLEISNYKFAFVCSLPLWVSSSALVSVTSSSIITISCDWEIWLSRLHNWGGDSVWTCLGEKMPLILSPLVLIQQQCCNQTVTQKDNGTSCPHVAWPVIPAHDLWMERVWFLLAADVQWGPWETAAPRLSALLPSIYKGKTQLNTLWAKQWISAAINVSTLIVFPVHPY